MKNKKTIKSILLSILCICCFIPIILVANGTLVLQRMGGMSTMGVIIGPIIIPDLDGGLSDMPAADNSKANLSADTPYSNGALRGYKSLGVYNIVRDSGSWNGFKYASYIRYFRIYRSDGRLIYDDDGILDVSTSKSNLASEIVNYPSYIYAVETTLPIKSGAGFMWTDQQAIFKSGGELSCVFGYTNANGTCSYVYDVPTEPTNRTETLETIMYKDGSGGPVKYYENLCITLNATGQYRNTFWGNTGGDVSVSANLTNYIAISKRDWSNTLTSNANTGKYKGQTIYYSPKEFTVIATNLNNYVKINDVQATSQYGTSVVPFADQLHRQPQQCLQQGGGNLRQWRIR